MTFSDQKNVAVVIRIVAGDFNKGFNVQFQLLDEGKLVGGQQSLRLPSAPQLPQIYKDWSEAYRQLGGTRKIPDQMLMSKIESVGGQKTHVSPGDECKKSTANLEAAVDTWFGHQEFQLLAAQITNKAVIDGRSILFTDNSIPVIFSIDTGDPQVNNLLKKMPWHQWTLFKKNLLNAEPVLSTGQIQKVKSLTLPINVLVVLGSSEGGLKLDTDKDAWSRLERLGARITILEQPSIDKLDNALRGEVEQLAEIQHWDILFFAGHSTTKKETLQDGYLQINDSETIELRTLDESLARARANGLKLAIFNSCDGLGLANFLANLELPFSIVMREPVPDVIARDFLEKFLIQFSNGQPLYRAMREARSRLRFRMGDPSGTYPLATWFPILCQNPTQPELFWPEPPQSPEESPEESPEPEFSEPESPTLFIPPESPVASAPVVSLNKLFVPALLLFGGAAVTAFIFGIIPGSGNKQASNNSDSVSSSSVTSAALSVSPIDSTVIGDSFSKGEEFLFDFDHSNEAKFGIESFGKGEYEKAEKHFRRALMDSRNNPEYVIYLNNTIARLSRKPIKTIAVSIPARLFEDQSNELLRGVGQFQAENNCGLDTLINGIENPDTDLQCQYDDTVLEVLIADHEHRNEENEILDRFNRIVADSNVLGIIGRYNSDITFKLEETAFDADYNIPIISTTSTAERQGGITSGTVFRTSPTDRITAIKWRDYLLDNEDIRKVVLLHDSDKYSQSLLQEVKEISLSDDVEQLDCNLEDINTCFTKIQEAPVDAIVLLPSDKTEFIDRALSFVQRYDDEFENTPILLGGDTLYDSDQVINRIGRDSLLSTLIVAVPWHRGVTTTSFEQGAQKLWNAAVNWRTIMSYDATLLLDTAIDQSAECSGNDSETCRTAIPEYLVKNGLNNGATGEIRFSDNGDRKRESEESRISVLVRVDLDDRTFVCLEGESCNK